jgi:hypothetical protein
MDNNQSQFNQNQYNKNTRYNPLVFTSFKSLDVEKLENDCAKELQKKKSSEEKEKREFQKLIENDPSVKEIMNKVNMAYINQSRFHQIKEKQTRQIQEIVKDAEIDEKLLSGLDEQKKKEQEIEQKKRVERLHGKDIILKQMKDRELQKEESKEEYLRDKALVDDIIDKIKKEDMAFINEHNRKKEIAKSYMFEAYEEKNRRKIQQKVDEKNEKEKERKYFEEVAKRDGEFKAKKQAIEDEKNKIFEKLSKEQAQKQAEKDYWENVRNELYIEEGVRRDKIKEIQEKEKKQRQKDEMLQSAIDHLRVKEQRKKEEEVLEREFKKKLMEKFAEDERLEQYNAIRRKQKELELKKEVIYKLII